MTGAQASCLLACGSKPINVPPKSTRHARINAASRRGRQDACAPVVCYSFCIVHETVASQEAAVTNETRWNLLQAKVQETRAIKAFTLFREHGIEPILIKGLSAARFYPEPGSRASVDMISKPRGQSQIPSISVSIFTASFAISTQLNGTTFLRTHN